MTRERILARLPDMSNPSTSGLGPVKVQFFGSLRVWARGTEVDVSSPAQQRIVARLALSAGQTVSTSALMQTVWAENPPTTAASSLQNHVSRLRSVLGPAAIRSAPAGYSLWAGAADVDALAFEEVAKSGRLSVGDGELGHRSRIARLSAALDLWIGPPLQEFADEEWALPTIARLADLRVVVREQLVESLLRTGDMTNAVTVGSELCRDEPLLERAHLLLMNGLAAQGRQAEALRVFTQFRRKLVNETGLEPSQALLAAEQAVLHLNTGAHNGGHRRTTWVTPLPVERTRLFGRTDDIAEITSLLITSPVISIIGPGGVGKSRVALRIAHEQSPNFGDDVYFVDLASAVGSDVGATICDAVGTPGGIDTIADHLRNRRMLLVLDCCERVIAPVAEVVTAVVTTCPHVRVLLTSREVLRISGERVFVLPPLGEEAVELFESRVQMIRRGFRTTLGNRKLVEGICHAVDNLPLAIELVAMQCAHLTLHEVSEKLTRPLDALDMPMRDFPPRHHGMRRALDWSWALVDPHEQMLFARLSIFAGGCSADAAEEVCGFLPLEKSQVVTTLGSLVRRSLVLADFADDRVRYRQLDTTRAYGTERLEELGETLALRHRYAEWIDRVLAEIAPLVASPREREVTEWLHCEAGSLRMHLNWAVDNGDTDLAMRFFRPVMASHRWRFVIEASWPYERIPAWRDHPDAPYVWMFVAATASDPILAHEAAMMCSLAPGFPENCVASALSEAPVGWA